MDPIIHRAQERMRAAASDFARGCATLRRVMRDLERHPDYHHTVRAGGSIQATTLAAWLHDCCEMVLAEIPAGSASDALMDDAIDGERNLREIIKDEAARL